MSRLRCARAACFCVAALLVAPAAAQESVGRVTTVEPPKGHVVQAATLADVDADGLRDLVLVSSRKGRSNQRLLTVHRRSASGFSAAPGHQFDLTPDVVAFAAGDVEPGGGDEVVFFTATGAFAWKPAAPEDVGPRKIVTATFLWQLPHPREAFVWSGGVRDVDGDGLDDVVMPEPDGYRIAVQRRDKAGSRFDAVSFLALPDALLTDAPLGRGEGREQGRSAGRRMGAELGIGGFGRHGDVGDLFGVSDTVPAPVFEDFDGDGMLDVVAQTTREFLVWRQTARGTFASDPTHAEILPLDVDRSRRLDLAFGLRSADLDRDGRVDCVVTAGDRRSEDPRTQVLVYSRAKGADASLFGEDGVPGQALFVGGFTARPELKDVNGDGYPDLALAAIEVDAIDAIRAAASGTLNARVLVYLNRRGKFARKPDVSLDIPVAAKAFRRARNLLATFCGDATGNGARDLLVRDDPERLRVFPGSRSRTGFSVGSTPIWETRIDDRATVRVEQMADGAPELLVIQNGRLLHVRFR